MIKWRPINGFEGRYEVSTAGEVRAENTQHAYDTKLNVKKQLPIEYKNEIKSLRKWCRELNLNYKLTWYRIRVLHWSVEKSFNKEVLKPCQE